MEDPVVALSFDELTAISNLTGPLPPNRRGDFLAAVEAALQGHVHGVGIVYRTAVGLLPLFFKPPEPTPPPVHYNARRMQAAARSTGIPARVRRDAK
jgi:hypothetical protein